MLCGKCTKKAEELKTDFTPQSLQAENIVSNVKAL
jgi:hypothetical protein